MQVTDFLVSIRQVMKLHEGMLKSICEAYRLTLAEANVIKQVKDYEQIQLLLL